METTLNIVSIIIIVFGILQIILFFKMWGMTNDVNNIRSKLEVQTEIEDQLITEAQIKSLSGDKSGALELYQKAFYKNLIELFEKTIKEFGDEDNLEYKERNEYYKSEHSKIVKYYSKRVNKLGMELNIETFDSYEKIYSTICKS